MSLDKYEGLFLKANIPTIHVKQFIKELKERINKESAGDYDNRERALCKMVDELAGKGLI